MSAQNSPNTPNRWVEGFVNRYQAAGELMGSQMLDRAAIIAEAHEELYASELILFYSRIRLNRYGPYARELREIGVRNKEWRPKKRWMRIIRNRQPQTQR